MSDLWQALNSAIAEARQMVAAEAADEATALEGEAYVARVVASAMTPPLLGHRLMEGGLSMPLPVYGGPNPDYIMRHSLVSADGKYRLEGNLNGSERVGVGLYSVGASGAPMVAGYTAFDRSNCYSDGSFALDLAAGLSGPGTLAIAQDVRIMLVRVLHRDNSPPALLRFTGAPEQRGPSLATGTIEGALGMAAHMIRANIVEYMKWVHAARNLANRLDAAPEELADTVIGDADTQYFLGGYDLGEGEWLEVILPGDLKDYWSLHAYNYWYEHLATPGVHDRNAMIGEDGKVLIAVGPELPSGAINRIDTLGRRRGAFVCRIVGNDTIVQPPFTRIVQLAI